MTQIRLFENQKENPWFFSHLQNTEAILSTTFMLTFITGKFPLSLVKLRLDK